LVCKLGDKRVDDAECPIGKPSEVEECNVNVSCSTPDEPCKPTQYCTRFLSFLKQGQDLYDLCEEHCCKQCD